jgi:hypothetical protein
MSVQREVAAKVGCLSSVPVFRSSTAPLCAALMHALQVLKAQSVLTYLDLGRNTIGVSSVGPSATTVGVLGGALRCLSSLASLSLESIGVRALAKHYR